MGLFSSEYKTTVGTVVARVIKDKLIPNSIRSGGLRAIVKDRDIPETVMDEISGSIALKAERMYEYARTKYTHGLPSGQFSSAVQGRNEVLAVLDSLHGANGFLEYCHYQTPNMQHIGWTKLVQNHGYNPTTNKLENLSLSIGKPVYLENMTLVIPDNLFNGYSLAALEQWGDPARAGYSPSRKDVMSVGVFQAHTKINRDDAAITPHIRVDYSWQDTIIETGSFLIPVAGYDNTADYFQVKYVNGQFTTYWMYKSGTGTYPTLDNVFIKAPAVNGSFYPFAYFRYGKVSEVSNKTTQAYKTSKKLVKYLGMNYDQIADGIEENPNIADVEQAMVIMAVPANSTDPLELKYLFSFFDALYDSNANQYSSPAVLDIALRQAGGVDIARSSLIIQDKRFKMALTNAGVTKKRVAGSIGKVGAHAFLLDQLLVTRIYTAELETGPQTITEQIPIKVHVYRKQVSYRIYEEIRVVSLQMLYHIYENYTATADDLASILLIPLDRSITSEYSLPDREVLYSRSLHYVFNSRLVTEIKWYQSGFFQFLMIVVAAVVAVYSMGSSFQALSLALSTGVNVSGAVMVLLTDLITGMAIGQILKMVVKAVGLEVALIIAAIAMAATGYIQFTGSGIPGAPWVEQILNLATGLAKAAQDVLGDMFKDLQNQFSELAGLAQEAEKALTEANKLLENNNYLSPIVIFGETPNDFYNRTIHSGNTGLLSISAISSYVDNALTLPKLAETLGESQYD